MNRSVRLSSLGALAGLLTWLVSEPFARTAANHGIRAGSSMFSVGSFYGWFAHTTLGATIVGFLALSVSLERNRPAKALLWGFAGLVLGGFMGWVSDSQSDRLNIHLLQTGAIPSIAVGLIWSFAVSMSLAIALALCTQPTPARAGRILIGGVAAAIASFVARIVLSPLSLVFVLIGGGRGGWEPYDPDRLIDHMVMGLILGLCVGLGDTVLTSARIRLVLGRNEGRDFELGSGLSRIGSAEGVEVPLFGGTGVAPVHAQIWRQDGRWHFADIAGGTRVNGQPVSGCLLQGGETIEIGSFVLCFTLKSSPNGAMAYYPPSPLLPVVPAAPAPMAEPVRIVAHRLVDPFGGVIDLREGATVLGRDAVAEVRLAHDGLVSRLHARVIVNGETATVEDLGSRNGTELNGNRITQTVPLKDGDAFRIGATTMVYRTSSS